ncbi:MAG TPA: flagellar motor switch protein FliN, partial [Bryobacteraceae bacterium]
MGNQKDTAEQITRWLADEWGRSFAAVIESMADQKPTATCDGVARTFTQIGAGEGALHVEQEFSIGPECILRLSVPELVWREAGTRVLRAAGIEEVGRDDALSTFHEVLSQTLSGVAQALTGRLGREVTCVARTEKETLPEDLVGLAVAINITNAEIADYPVFISPDLELIEQCRAMPAPEPAANPNMPSPEPVERAGPGHSSVSKTFDLLLGVNLPVSVSFGKTSMMVKEVLKLTTGSIVELNRSVTEPVDIIVNNCIIARGEVVVVAGNYGVRVKEIVSREQRYQTGIRP